MSGEIRTSVIVDMAGNLAERARAFTRAMSSFSRSGSRSLAFLRNAAQAAGQGLDRLGNRYTALITGAAGAGTARMLIGLETRLVRLGIQANLGTGAVDRLKRQVFEVAQAADVRVSPDQLLDALDAIVEKTGDLQFAEENLRNIGLAIQATGATGRDIGELLSEFQKIGIRAPEEVLKVFDTLNLQGKEGAFTLQNLAALGPRVVQAYVSTGRGGAQAMREMGAALQLIRMGTGSSEMAATAFEAVIRTLSDPQKLKLLQQGGIQVFDPEQLKQGREVLRPINELMVDIIRRARGKKTVLAQIFDAEALRAFNVAVAEFQRTGAIESLDRFMRIQGDGSATIADSARAARTAGAALTNLVTAWQRFADANLAGPIQSAADALNSLDPDTVQRWLKIGGYVAAAFGALIVGRKLYNAGRFISGLLRPGGTAGEAAPAGRLGGAASGVVPVWVVNFGAMPGVPAGAAGSVGKAAGALGRAARTVGALASRAGAVGGAFAAGYGAGSLIYQAIEGTTVADKIGAAVARALAAFGNREAKVALEIRSRESVAVAGMRASGLDVDVDTGPLMVMP